VFPPDIDLADDDDSEKNATIVSTTISILSSTIDSDPHDDDSDLTEPEKNDEINDSK
jgi:hypothetical protein